MIIFLIQKVKTAPRTSFGKKIEAKIPKHLENNDNDFIGRFCCIFEEIFYFSIFLIREKSTNAN